MIKKRLVLEDLQAQYEAFCDNVRSVKQNTYWRTAFNKIEDTPNNEEKDSQAL